jgi:hypothetical protein
MLHTCAVKFVTVVFREKFLDLNTLQVEKIIILDQSKTKQAIKLLVGAGSIGDEMEFNLLLPGLLEKQ